MSLINSRRWLAPIAALALLLFMVSLSPDFGSTWDERFQQGYGERIWEYIHGRLPRSEFDNGFGNQDLYGGLVELTCVAVQHVLDADVYVVRHAVISIFGWLGIIFCGRLAARLFGVRAGWLAAILLAAAPRYFGHSMNNPKDAPFAALAMMALYYILTISPRPPHLSWGHAAKLGVAIALTINVRPLGVALVGYAALVMVMRGATAMTRARDRVGWSRLLAAAGRLAVVLVIALPAGTLVWPWAQGQPLTRPLEAFSVSARADWALGFPVLYAGQDLVAQSVPWHYVPVWLLIGLPPVILAGLALTPIVWRRNPGARVAVVALAAFVTTPVVAAIVRHATLYDEIRHLLFIVPPLVVLSSGGWSAALDAVHGRGRAAVLVALLVGLSEPVVFQIRNHPNQDVYFSPFMGGPRAAFARFDMDYWGNCVLQAVQWSAGVASRTGMPLGVAGNLPEATVADVGRYPSLWFTSRNAADYHLDIRLLRGQVAGIRDTAARRDAVYRVTTADGTPLCVVLPGPAYPSLKERLDKLGQPDDAQ